MIKNGPKVNEPVSEVDPEIQQTIDQYQKLKDPRYLEKLAKLLNNQATTPVSDMSLDDPNTTTEADASPEGSRLTSKETTDNGH